MATTIKHANSNGLGKQIPPAFAHVLIFFDQAGFSETEAIRFYDHYEEMHWCGLKGRVIRNWKTKAQEWFWEIKQRNPHMRIK